MGAKPRYRSPLDQLRERLVELREAGVAFERAWVLAVRPGQPVVMVTAKNPPPYAVLWPTDRNDRVAWQNAIIASREGWRRAYERQPPLASEAALDVLAGLFEELARQAETVDLAA